MARLALNKASLTREIRRLKNFERFLPSLELKRKQLLLERMNAKSALARTEKAIEPVPALVAERLPMLANTSVDLTNLVRVRRVRMGTENVVGTELPTITSIELEAREYGYLGRPHWVDAVAALLHQHLEDRIRVQVERERLARLDRAVRRITQRVNLFEKVLIPRARENIRRLRIYLSDSERAAVVRGKIAKRKQQQAMEMAS